MIRTLAIATAAAAALSMPALAAEKTATESSVNAADVTAAYSTALANEALAKQAVNVLAQKGYVSVAITGRDDSGRFTGTAYKDGKPVYVAVEMPKREAPVTN